MLGVLVTVAFVIGERRERVSLVALFLGFSP
jgi:hypothetical protein